MASIDSMMDELNRVSSIRDKVYKKTMQIRDLIEDINILIEPLLDDWNLGISINQVPTATDWEEFKEKVLNEKPRKTLLNRIKEDPMIIYSIEEKEEKGYEVIFETPTKQRLNEAIDIIEEYADEDISIIQIMDDASNSLYSVKVCVPYDVDYEVYEEDKTPLRLGEIIYEDDKARIDKIDERVLWDFDIYLAVFIRDYLLAYNKAPDRGVPSIMFERHKGNMSMDEAIEKLDQEELDREYTQIVEDLANKFDYLANFLNMEHEDYSKDLEVYERYIKEAFDTLAEFFPSLWT